MHTNVRAALLDPKSDMATIFFAALAALEYDLEAMALDAESVLRDIQDDLGQPLSATNRIKLITAQKIAFTDLIYQDEAEFNFAAIVTQTPADPPSLTTFEPADIEDVAWLMVEAQIIDTATDEDYVEDTTNYFTPRKRPDDFKAGPMEYAETIWKLCGALLALEGLTHPISALPKAIVPKAEIDANMDPDLYASLQSRDGDVEQEVAKYIIDRLTILLAQLQKIPTAEGEPLVTKQMSEEWLAGVSADLLKRQPENTSTESGGPDQASTLQ